MKKVKSGSDISFSFNVKVTDKTTVDEIIREASDIIKVRFAEYKVEPEESEDEKIRRTLVEYFGPQAQLDFIRGVPIQKIRDWLEKQKEQPISAEEVLARAGLKPYKDGNQWCILAGDNIQEGICGFGDTIEDALYEFLKEVLDLQKEQKFKMTPKWLYRLEFKDSSCGLWYDGYGKWCFESGIGSISGCKTKTLPMDYDARYKQDGRDWFSSCSRKEDLMHWYSLEDAKELISKGFVFTRYLATEYHEYEQQTVFIKETALYREEIDIFELLGQKPAEWSEEDELMRTAVIQTLKMFEGRGTTEMQIDWLKSLRPVSKESLQPHWKPSEEQMDALKELIDDAHRDGWVTPGATELYAQLKKLM